MRIYKEEIYSIGGKPKRMSLEKKLLADKKTIWFLEFKWFGKTKTIKIWES